MFVILTYDVRQKRERQLNLLEQELENVINPDEDSLCVYKVPYYRNVTKDELGFSMASDMKVM